MTALIFPKRNAETDSLLHRWARMAALVTAGFVVLLFLLVAWVYAVNWMRYDNALDQVESRISRLDGILGSTAEIDSRLEQARQAVDPWFHNGGAAGQNALLQRLRELVVSNGATLISSQVAAVPAESEQKLPKVRISATVTGEWSQLVQLSAALQAQRPPYLVHALNVQREGQANNKTTQKARMTLQLDAPTSGPSDAEPAERKP